MGGSARFSAYLDPSWGSLLDVHGGYVAAVAVLAAQELLPDRDVRTVSTCFLRPAKPGPADLLLDVLRVGRSFGTVAARVQQAGRDLAAARITLLKPGRPVSANSWSTALVDRPAPRARCVPFRPPPAIAHFAQADFLIDPATIPAGNADDARIAGHIRPAEDRPIDAPWLLVMGDWFPPSPFRRLAFPAGGISIDYTIHIHRTLAADPGRWLEGVFVSAQSHAGIALEHGTLATPDGVPVAETFHTRWTG